MTTRSPSSPLRLALVLLLVALAAAATAVDASPDRLQRRQSLTSTAGIPATPNVGTGAPVATIPDGLGGLSTGTSVQFTPGASSPAPPVPFIAPTDAAGSASLASILTHYSQGMTAPTPTTGPPTGISTGLEGGFTGTATSSVLDGRVTTIDNAATTYTGPRPSSSASGAAANNAAAGATAVPLFGAAWVLSGLLVVAAGLGGGAILF
ncbi:uncharacterized protein PFL1_04006 [Pseudozyma flocculosa PF-1]|uniref:Uncharacterized protein n=2 Tax=Pseudozyma flocculosa TaxID=84751 RepID=A0A5C3EXQ8_9BASI|nr:uncharacterized protein PFL1_04006 [Pseudozyma flocculosa PF-1]EPQ28703.1 hypothetical protein PFL1_04006 [Pseudozyma flocculosa PF-1]SPO36660.1 uncharacterized protein PSFLO_02131 [Pseudozyma flocculosa]